MQTGKYATLFVGKQQRAREKQYNVNEFSSD